VASEPGKQQKVVNLVFYHNIVLVVKTFLQFNYSKINIFGD